MLCMETIVKLRRRHLVKGESISAIARDFRLSRNTVRKYLKAETEPRYQREHQPIPKLGAFQRASKPIAPSRTLKLGCAHRLIWEQPLKLRQRAWKRQIASFEHTIGA